MTEGTKAHKPWLLYTASKSGNVIKLTTIKLKNLHGFF